MREARSLADAMLERFWDDQGGAFYDTANDAEALIVRPRDYFDNATPSGTSAATRALLHLGALVGEPRYEQIAVRSLEGLAGMVDQVPQAFGNLLCALDFHLATPQEVAVVGEPGRDDTEALLGVLRSRYLPNTVIASSGPAARRARESPFSPAEAPWTGAPRRTSASASPADAP